MKTILNTRPSHQSATLSRLIKANGGDVVELPMLTIEPITFKITNIADYKYLVFLSANAVTHFFTKPIPPISTETKIIAIGPATKMALQKVGIKNVTCPEHFSSEGLLKLPFFNSTNSTSILIISGENSKALLSQKLTSLGHKVSKLICYRRMPHTYDMKKTFHTIVKRPITTIVVTSCETLSVLLDCFSQSEHRNWLIKKQLCVISNQMAQTAISAGFTDVIESPNATNDAIIKTLFG